MGTARRLTDRVSAAGDSRFGESAARARRVRPLANKHKFLQNVRARQQQTLVMLPP